MDFTSLYPGSASLVGLDFNVIVSPTLISATFFMLAAIYPTSPAQISPVASYSPGLKYPTSVISYSLLLDIVIILSPFFNLPSIILTYATAPM